VASQFSAIIPVVQAQDGSYAGIVQTGEHALPSTIWFDQSGNLRWIVSNEQSQTATADGGVIGRQIPATLGNTAGIGTLTHTSITRCLLACSATCAIGQCRPPHFQVGATLLNQADTLVQNISMPLEEFAPRKLVCLAARLK
jgi:hypothetical protein